MPFKRFLQISGSMVLVGALSGLVCLVVLLAPLARDLPGIHDQIKSLRSGMDPLATEVYDRNGQKIGEYSDERRYYVPLKQIPKHVVQAFLSAEDKDFYNHPGVNPLAMVRSLLANLRSGAIRQGGSTITQQVTRLYFLDRSRTYERKIKEIALAVLLEMTLSKDEILEIYLNKIFLGNRSFGIEAACRNYFRKSVVDISIGEAAMLAGLPRSPTQYAPHKHPQAASERQGWVLRRMEEDGFLAGGDAAAWARRTVYVAPGPEDHFGKAPYFLAAVKQEMQARFELSEMRSSGFKIRTSLDFGLQKAAERALVESLKKVRAGAVSGVGRKGRIQGAIATVDPRTGAILAMQGGADFLESQFNRAEDTRRRIGGLVIPMMAALAMEQGFTLANRIGDDPIGGRFHKKSSGRLTLFETLVRGDVLEAAPLITTLGVGTFRDFSSRLGLHFSGEDVTLGLGFGEASPIEVATAFIPFAGEGRSAENWIIESITDRSGKEIYRRSTGPVTAEVMSPETAFIVRHAMREAVNSGHAHAAAGAIPGLAGIGAVTDDLHNTWFAAVTPSHVSAVWIGAETGQTRLAKDESAARDAAASVWRSYIMAAPAAWRSADPGPAEAPARVSFHRVNVSGKDGPVRQSIPFLSGTAPRGAVTF